MLTMLKLAKLQSIFSLALKVGLNVAHENVNRSIPRIKIEQWSMSAPSIMFYLWLCSCPLLHQAVYPISRVLATFLLAFMRKKFQTNGQLFMRQDYLWKLNRKLVSHQSRVVTHAQTVNSQARLFHWGSNKNISIIARREVGMTSIKF